MTTPSIGYQILRYQKSDREDVFAFVRSAYSDDDSYRLMRQWDWKYDANPFNCEAEPYILLMREGRHIIAMLGGIPLRVVIRGQEHWVSHSCDWVVHPDYRDRHLARRLTERHRADRALRFSWQNETSYQRSQRRPDTGTLRIVPLVKVLDFDYIVQRLTRTAFLGRLGGVVADGARRLTRPFRAPAARPGVTITPMDSCDPRFDVLWQRVGGTHPVMVVRDQRYLAWRFAARPDARYTILAATQADDLMGYMIVRLAEAGGVRWGYVVDFLIADASTVLFALLIRHAVDHLRRQGAKAISCRTTVPSYRRMLYGQGFCPYRSGQRGYFRANVNTPDPAVRIFRDTQQWYLTMGDGDLEMVF